MLCAHSVKQGTCKGDSGGPLLICDTKGGDSIIDGNPDFDLLVGIVSFGPATCDSTKADVYTRVSSFRKWIDEKIGNAPSPTATPSESVPISPPEATISEKSTVAPTPESKTPSGSLVAPSPEAITPSKSITAPTPEATTSSDALDELYEAASAGDSEKVKVDFSTFGLCICMEKNLVQHKNMADQPGVLLIAGATSREGLAKMDMKLAFDTLLCVFSCQTYYTLYLGKLYYVIINKKLPTTNGLILFAPTRLPSKKTLRKRFFPEQTQ
ncbi:hypothetical protein BSKO_04721 [Bryopsis sp. KO-2023]|nr:hypothetical protein BSKO_04721 [Bryopsis sp. KO-2023]